MPQTASSIAAVLPELRELHAAAQSPAGLNGSSDRTGVVLTRLVPVLREQKALPAAERDPGYREAARLATALRAAMKADATPAPAQGQGDRLVAQLRQQIRSMQDSTDAPEALAAAQGYLEQGRGEQASFPTRIALLQEALDLQQRLGIEGPFARGERYIAPPAPVAIVVAAIEPVLACFEQLDDVTLTGALRGQHHPPALVQVKAGVRQHLDAIRADPELRSHPAYEALRLREGRLIHRIQHLPQAPAAAPEQPAEGAPEPVQQEVGDEAPAGEPEPEAGERLDAGAVLAGLPDRAIYCHIKGKAPQAQGWNQPRNLLTKEQVTGKVPSWATGIGMVTGRLSELLVVDPDTKPEFPLRAAEVFHNLTGHRLEELPVTATCISGRPDRFKAIYRVPPEWQPLLSGYSVNLTDLEVRYEDGWDAKDGPQPKAKQVAIHGPHDKSPEWFFRWQEGRSPAEVGIVDAPVWLLAAVVKRRGIDEGLRAAREEGEERGGHGIDPNEPAPCDLLTPRQSRTLVRLLSPGWPRRGGEAGTRFSGSYKVDGWMKLIAALNNVLGPVTTRQWLGDTDWFKKHTDWGRSSSMEAAMQSIAKSEPAGKEAGWGTLVYLATRTKDDEGKPLTGDPVKLPDWFKPPRQADAAGDDEATAEMRQDAYRQWDKARRVELALSDVFPPALAKLLQDRADAFPVAPSAMLAPTLTTLASVLGKRYRVKVKAGHIQPMVLWMGTVSAPGTLKTPVGAQVIAPLRQLEREGWAQYKAERKEYHATPADDRGPSPIPPRAYLVQDCTIEGLSELLQDGDRTPGLLGYYDELAAFFGGMDAYRSRGVSKDRTYWLGMWSCESYKILRKGSPEVFVDEPAVSLFGSIQPDKLVELVHGDGASTKGGDGFWSRFLWVAPPYVFPKTNWDEVTITSELRQIIDLLCDLTPGINYAELSDGAKTAYEAHTDRYSEMARDTYPAREAMLNKLKGYLARFAGLLHALWFVVETEQPLSGMVQPISEETMERAALLTDFFLAQFDALAPALGGSNLPDWVTRIVRLAESEKNTDRIVTTRDVQRKLSIGTAEAAREMLTQLVEQFGLGRLLPTGRADRVTWHYPDPAEAAS